MDLVDRVRNGVINSALRRQEYFLIIGPPRTATTTIERCLQNHSSNKGSFCHEPCDRYCHENAGIGSIVEALVDKFGNPPKVIKEMTFQMGTGDIAIAFIENAKEPIIFVIRDPLLAIESRCRMILQDLLKEGRVGLGVVNLVRTAIETRNYHNLGDILTEDVFPLKYIGWKELPILIDICRQRNRRYIVIDTTDLRNDPEPIIRQLCDQSGIQFEESMLDWREDFQVTGLPQQDGWYTRIEKSKGILKPDEPAIKLEQLPTRFQEAAKEALGVYQRALQDPNRTKFQYSSR